MNGREWRPGDVAIRHGQFEQMRGLFVSACGSEEHDGGDTPHWHYSNGGWSPASTATRHSPLVAIDPEDREQCRELADRIAPNMNGNTNATQAALREMVTVKPAEPTGAAAVVVDAVGDWWVRLSRGADGAVWHRIGIPEVRANWRDVTAVRVLSEGVEI